MRRLWILVLIVGCSSRPSAEEADVAPAAPAALAEIGPSEVLLDRLDGVDLIGTLEAAPPNADPDRVLVLCGAGLDGRRVLDARFVAGGVVVIDADHGLRFVRGEEETELDAGAEGPISVSGDVIAYVRGELPDFEVIRAEPATGAVVAVAPQLTPAWSPALSPDGGAVVFVTSASGSPALHRSDGGALPTTRFPTMPSAPVWLADDRLVFEDEDGLAWVDLASGEVLRRELDLRSPIALEGALLARRGGVFEVLR